MGVMELQTENNLQYQLYPVAAGSIRFKVRASKDAHIALTTGPNESDPIYEVFIGGWNNTKSVIRKNKNKPDKVEVATPGILNAGVFRDFYIRWDGGRIAAHREGESMPFMSWEDPEPFPITSVGVCTGWGATGTWKFENGDEFDSLDNLEYKFIPVNNGYLDFDYWGPDSCDICLTSSLGKADPVYEIILGGWENTKSVIRLNRQKPDKVVVSTPGITNPDKFKKFLLEWNNGRVTLRDRMASPDHILMEWTDPAPFPIAFFGVRSGYGARGQWRINHYFQTPAPANFTEPAFGEFVWIDVTDGKFPPGAVVGGKDASGEQIIVARARHQRDLVPGMLLPSHGRAYVPWDGQVHEKPKYQVLVGGPTNWQPASGDKVPVKAVPAGETATGEPLFVGRVYHKGSIITGKVHQSHKTCYIPFGGKEVTCSEYEVLVA